MTLRQLFERIRIKFLDVQDGELVLLFNQYAEDFCLRAEYGAPVYIENIEEEEEEGDYIPRIENTKVLKLYRARINNIPGRVLYKSVHDLVGQRVSYPDTYFVSVFRHEARLWRSDSKCELIRLSWRDVNIIELYGIFYTPYTLDDIDMEIDNIIANGVFRGINFELLLREPELVAISKDMLALYEMEIRNTKRKYHSIETPAVFFNYDM